MLRSGLSLACFMVLGSAGGVARAEPSEDKPSHLEASLGARVSSVASAGYDPFAASDELAQVSFGVGATAVRAGPFSLAGVGFWDYGTHTSTARGEPTSLTVQRLSVGPEFRLRIFRRFFAFAHILPAFTHSDATLNDPVAEATREARHWAYGFDSAAGAAFELYRARAAALQPKLWAVAEGGYGYLSSTRLVLKAAGDSSAPERASALDLGSLSLSGPYARLSLAVSF